MGCYVIHLDYTILPLTYVIHIYLSMWCKLIFYFFASQPFTCGSIIEGKVGSSGRGPFKCYVTNCPVASGGHVAKAIHQMQHTQHYHREYARRRAVRMHRMYSRLRRIKAYRDTKQRRRDIDVYKKGQLDTAPRLSHVKTGKNTARSQTITHTKAQPKRLNTQSHREHPYSLRSTPLDHTYSFETCS